MLPSVVTSELEQVAADAIRTAFHPTTPGFRGLIERFLKERGRLLKGPYVSIALPFRQGSRRNWFPEIPLGFSPYLHQEKAFQRLMPGSPRNTLIGTGTGSGKTECFLLPLLEHCRQQRLQGCKGIKAILIYPMNALATDQARRTAERIHTTVSLKGLRAGLYIGGAPDDSYTAAMAVDSVITDKAALHQAPPDILLTNYKQLDYLLMQPHVQGLWRHNTPHPDGSSVLRYLVVDEFHTFDGAQGTDLACLIRRLRDRLHCPGAALICVGTSATLGGPESRAAMGKYAGQIFASHFDADALIEEERLSPEEFFSKYTAYDDDGLFALPLPGPDCQQQLDPDHASSASDYLQIQARLWLNHALGDPPDGDTNNETWRLELGQRLGTLPAVHNLVRQAADTCSVEELLERFSRQLGLGDQYSRRYRVLVLDSLLALIAHARRPPDGSEVVKPWLHLRQQFWLRELKRMVASVEKEPLLKHSDDISGNDSSAHLPVVHCRACGATAWASTVTHQGSNKLDRAANLRNFYKAFFSDQPELRYLFPQDENGGDHLLCSECLSFHKTEACKSQGAGPKVCPNCQSPALLPVEIPDCSYTDRNGHPRVSHDCPHCHAHQGLLLIGLSAASLTSTWSASLFASDFNSDKKLLAFSDSVQDAAHRAGFVAARAFRTSFRTALTRTVKQHGPASLEQLQETLIQHWQRELPNPVDFAATFLPPDLEWLEEWDQLQQQDTPTLSDSGFLLRCVKLRLRWDVAAEFGYRSRIGSSVEQAGALAAAVDSSPMQDSHLLLRLQNEIEPLRATCTRHVQQLVVGLLQHWRQCGAIAVPELAGANGQGSPYLHSGGANTFLLNRHYWHTPNFGRSANKPLFPTSYRGKGHFEQLVVEKGRPTWSQHWLQRTLKPTQALDANQQKEALHLVVSALTEAGLLKQFSSTGHPVWAIPRSVIRVQAQPRMVRCEYCGDTQSVLPQQLPLWDDMPCLVRHCPGRYRPDARPPSQTGLPLYKRLYEHGQVRRIVAQEHTGLLERAHRERLEKQFIRGQFRSDPNLLSATSTLEMGINIGDLSSVLLASVPPEPANYLQRIGRAGRRDGNAVIGTLVNGTPHDLYFFADPRTMLQGQVSPPGCYLNAAAILKRQLIAYSLDRWVQSGISQQALPKPLKPVLDAVQNGKGKTDAFPATWLRWTQDRQGELLERFLALFADDLDPASRQELGHVFLARAEADNDVNPGALFAQELISRFEQLVDERRRLSSEVRKLQKRSKEFTDRPEASLSETERENKEAIRRERLGYNQLRKELDNRPLLAMLTDEGFLPNYTFPEAGVTLKSLLWRRLPRRDDGPVRSKELPPLRYERPANVAIRELVPDGQFYAQGRRVRVDQVDPKLNKPEEWRFCPACSFACKSTDDAFGRKECPRCGHSSYADSGQVKEMVKLTQVQATTEDAKSRFGDDRDERNPQFFHRELLILPDHQRREMTLAVTSEEFPFGAEYLSGTVFREINFGENTTVGGSHEIAGKKLKVKGFALCSSCGKVQQHGFPQANNHTWSCRYRDKPDDAKLRRLLFMYREFSSEAVRFLLPGASFWDESGLSSFVGALHLGLRQRFSGKVDHLQSALGDEPQGGQQRKTFLYLFDSVPGGTGYLRQLMDRGGSDLKEVFEQSLDALQTCSCSDGCY